MDYFIIYCANKTNYCYVLGIFPEPNIDPVIQIANIVKLHGAEDVFERNIFTLNTCASIGHAEVCIL